MANNKNFDNTSNLNKQGDEGKRNMMNEDEYFSKINQIDESITLSKKIGIFLSSFKIISTSYFIIVYLVPLLFLFLTLFMESAGEALLEMLRFLYIIDVTTVDALYQHIIGWLGNYFYYVNFGWFIDLISFKQFGINQQYMYYHAFLEHNFALTKEQLIFFSIAGVATITFTFTFTFWLLLSYYLIPKAIWDGNNDKLEFLTKELQKKISESTTLISSEQKEKAMNKVKTLKKEIIEELKRSLSKTNNAIEATQLLQVIPAYKISLINKDSIFGNQIASIANKRWKEHVKDQTTLKTFDELQSFLLESNLKKNQQDILKGLNWQPSLDKVFLTDLEMTTKFNSKEKSQFKKSFLQIMMVTKYFKNYPLYAAIRFLGEKGLKLEKEELILLTNSKKIIENQLKNPSKILDLSLELTLPNIKDQIIKKTLLLEYDKFTNVNNKEIALLENEAATDIAWEPDTRFKIMMKEYKQKYIKILEIFVKTVFDNYNLTRSDNFEANITNAFNEFFENYKIEVPLAQIAKYKVIKLEDFYIMLDMVLKYETIYNVTIKPLYVDYFEQLKIKDILYKEGKK